jgi:hypothetical protein
MRWQVRELARINKESIMKIKLTKSHATSPEGYIYDVVVLNEGSETDGFILGQIVPSTFFASMQKQKEQFNTFIDKIPTIEF